jgi:hypothetical protein
MSLFSNFGQARLSQFGQVGLSFVSKLGEMVAPLPNDDDSDEVEQLQRNNISSRPTGAPDHVPDFSSTYKQENVQQAAPAYNEMPHSHVNEPESPMSMVEVALDEDHSKKGEQVLSSFVANNQMNGRILLANTNRIDDLDAKYYSNGSTDTTGQTYAASYPLARGNITAPMATNPLPAPVPNPMPFATPLQPIDGYSDDGYLLDIRTDTGRGPAEASKSMAVESRSNANVLHAEAEIKMAVSAMAVKKTSSFRVPITGSGGGSAAGAFISNAELEKKVSEKYRSQLESDLLSKEARLLEHEKERERYEGIIADLQEAQKTQTQTQAQARRQSSGTFDNYDPAAGPPFAAGATADMSSAISTFNDSSNRSNDGGNSGSTAEGCVNCKEALSTVSQLRQEVEGLQSELGRLAQLRATDARAAERRIQVRVS